MTIALITPIGIDQTLNELPARAVLKYLLLGDERVGKTSIARRFLGQKFDPIYHESIGVNISTIDLQHHDQYKYKVMFWDMAGSEKFKQMQNIYFQGSQGVFLVSDVTREHSLDNLLSWFEYVTTDQLQNISIALLLNKIDLLEDEVNATTHVLPIIEGLKAELGVPAISIFETSALTGEGIYGGLHWLIDETLYHDKKNKEFWSAIFDAVHYPLVLFKFTDMGCEPIIADVEAIHHVPPEEIDTYLIKLGIKLSVITAQGDNYTTGINDIAEGKGGEYRLLVYTFWTNDPTNPDTRLRKNLLQLVMFIPMRYYPYFPAFTKTTHLFEKYSNKHKNIDDISETSLQDLRAKVLAFVQQDASIRHK